MNLQLRLLIPLAALLSATAAAQPFGIVAQIGANSTAVSPGGTVQVAAAAVGAATSVRFTISYRGTSTATLTGVSGSGSGDFAFQPVAVPTTLSPGAGVSAPVIYTPSSGQGAQAQLAITYTEGQSTNTTTFVINLNGTAPDLVYSYAFAGGNAQALINGATIQFPSTLVNATQTATVSILNRGSGPGSVSNVSLTGSAFQLGGLQLPPYNINAGAALSFTVAFAPTDRNLQTGALSITTPSTTVAFNLQGTGTSAAWQYTVVKADGTTAVVLPGQAITFPDTNVAGTSKLTILAANNGNGPGTITAINIAGAAYTITSQPFLPATVAVGSQVQTVLAFAPTTPGVAPGALKIGDDSFTLTANGVGPHISYSYAIGGAVTQITAGGTVQFSPSKIGQSNAVSFSLTNDGNAATSVNTIFLSGNSVFTLVGLPGLPLNLNPNDTATFNVRFVPTATGVSQASLQVGAASFTVSGSAVAPDPLPNIILTGPSGATQPRQQLTYTLQLAQPYSIDVVGTLSLGFNSAVFSNDPTVQFATGGQTVNFGIAAGTTTAYFPNNTTQISIQTGTVAGAITIVPSFQTTTGLDITPATVPGIALTIPQQAPVITGLSISGLTSTGFTLNISGYSTSRSVTQIGLTFTGSSSGTTLSNSTATVASDTTFQAWYQTGASQTAGSAFTATLPITLSGNSTAPANLTQALQSVAVTLTNGQGTSTAQSVNVQ